MFPIMHPPSSRGWSWTAVQLVSGTSRSALYSNSGQGRTSTAGCPAIGSPGTLVCPSLSGQSMHHPSRVGPHAAKCIAPWLLRTQPAVPRYSRDGPKLQPRQTAHRRAHKTAVPEAYPDPVIPAPTRARMDYGHAFKPAPTLLPLSCNLQP